MHKIPKSKSGYMGGSIASISPPPLSRTKEGTLIESEREYKRIQYIKKTL